MADKILIIEDEVSLRETLTYSLEKEGYQVRATGDGKDGLQLARVWLPDLLLLDIMLPSMDGFEICRILRPETDIPILMLTARADEIDRVVGLEIGADDYILKPFSMRELVARIKIRLRTFHQLKDISRQEPTPGTYSIETFSYHGLEIDLVRHEVRLNDQILALKPKEFDLLLYLVKHRGQALTREQILQEVWGWDYIGESRTVDVHVRWLRSKIEQNAANPSRIITVPGIGYRFEG
jgi:DNA-binding response OmpR family regulator